MTAFADQVTGTGFVPGDAGALARAIAAALDDPAARTRWSAEAIARTETGYNTQVMAERFLALMARLG